ncbi:caspase family protein [Laspinema olomoucense]|uniref:caspase family protein n=1 Tax=Laspinema olomoucense TaxID=3231600 RepID=UPI0021BB20B3|nr:caspase family protein [Laspinema sp. D3d]MCT7975894.1 caspase family protein [Laspinema sp. D3d]
MTEIVMNSNSTFYALLIGVDYYLPNPLYKNLQGCVKDINLVADYLKKALKIPTQQIFKLISPHPNTLETVDCQDLPPTYENIVKTFKKITDIAQPQDRVYIHYSGHGGRALTIYPELKGNGQYDEGLVPLDVGELEGHYLRDVELATLLKNMTDKELTVTVILDSCHSGGATRGDCDIRGSESPDFAPRPIDSAVASREELIENWQMLTKGNGTSLSGLPPSKDYVLLAACRPTEYAYEYNVNGKDRHGALTYWMIDTLSSTTSPISYKSLYERITAKIQSKFPSQLPMLLGEANRLVFGRDCLSTPYTVTVMKVDEKQKQVTLNAGLAQGLSSGTRFAIYPLNTIDFSNKQLQLVIIEVTEVEASSSSAKVLEIDAGGIAIKGQIEQGCPAVMVSAPVDLVRRVRLFDQKQAGEKENELPPELVAKQKQALEAVRQDLKDNGWVIELQPNDNREAHYQVAVGRNEEYEICTGMPIKNLRPELKINEQNAAKTVINRLVHLAKYQTVQELDNPASELADCIKFDLCDEKKQPFSSSTNLILQDREAVYLRVKNTSYQTLNIALLDLEPTWAISPISIKGIPAPFYQLQSQEELFIGRIRPTIPEGKGYEQVTETLKLFATRGLADFRWLELTPLDEEFDKKGNLHQELEEIAKEFTTRGEAQSINPLNNLLITIGSNVNNPPKLTRAMVYEPDPNAEWLTKQIQVTIKRA